MRSLLKNWRLILLLKLAPFALSAQGGVEEFRQVHMGMELRILVSGDVASLQQVAAAAFTRASELEMIFSDWVEESELSRLSTVSPGVWTPVSEPLMEVLSFAMELAIETDGAFDPTIGPLTQLWRESRRTGVPAHNDAVENAMQRVGYRWVELDRSSLGVRLLKSGMKLDLGAVAKGWILDDLVRTLRELGVSAALVEAGGDIVVHGAPPESPGWRVVVPRSDGADTVLTLTSGGISSSGPEYQWIPGPDGRRESHVISTETGRGMPDGRAATVVARSGMLADALSTVLTLVPREMGQEIANRYGVAYLILN